MKEFYLEVAAAGGMTFRTGLSLRNALLGLPYDKQELVVLQLTGAQVVHILNKLEIPIIHNNAISISADGLDIRIIQNIQELNDQIDFTIHNIYMNALTDVVYDPFHGVLDLRNKVIRASKKVFQSNPIKMIEACRLVGELGFTLSLDTWWELYNNARIVKLIDPNTIREELTTILLLPMPSVVFKQLKETTLLEYIIPDLASCSNVIQSKRAGVTNVFDHIMYALDACEKRLDLRLVILFHDIAKPQTLHCNPDGTIHFFKHEIYGAKIAKTYLKYWNFPRDIIHRIPHLILHHMFDADPKMVDKTVKRLIRKVGKEYIFDLLKVREADRGGTSEKISMKKVKSLRKKIERILQDDSSNISNGSTGIVGSSKVVNVEDGGRAREGGRALPAISKTSESKEIIGNTTGTDIGTVSTVPGELPIQP
jgi:hypothetical protein